MKPYQQFKASPVINKRFSSWSNDLQNLGALLDSKKKFSDKFNAVVYVRSVCHSFSKLLLRFRFPGRAQTSLAELPEGIGKWRISRKWFDHEKPGLNIEL